MHVVTHTSVVGDECFPLHRVTTGDDTGIVGFVRYFSFIPLNDWRNLLVRNQITLRQMFF